MSTYCDTELAKKTALNIIISNLPSMLKHRQSSQAETGNDFVISFESDLILSFSGSVVSLSLESQPENECGCKNPENSFDLQTKIGLIPFGQIPQIKEAFYAPIISKTNSRPDQRISTCAYKDFK